LRIPDAVTASKRAARVAQCYTFVRLIVVSMNVMGFADMYQPN